MVWIPPIAPRLRAGSNTSRRSSALLAGWRRPCSRGAGHRRHAQRFFRLTRGSALSARQAAYVEAARAVGATDRRILLRHILPNINPSLVLLATMRLGVLVLAGGELSFIGLGAQPPQPE